MFVIFHGFQCLLGMLTNCDKILLNYTQAFSGPKTDVLNSFFVLY